MKIYLDCMQCSQESLGEIQDGIAVEYTEDGFYFFECKSGHKNFVIFQEEKFETLFQIGANAILDGYYREAVSSFTSSLERFYEFCIKTFCKKNNIPNETIKSAYEFFTNSSERQFGSFLFLYLLEMKNIPFSKTEDDEWRCFRNKVIHKGLIPTRIEALTYGDYVRKSILNTILTLQENYSNEIQSLIGENIQSKANNNKYGCSNTTRLNSNIISLVNGDIEKKLHRDFEDCLNLMRASQNAMARCRK